MILPQTYATVVILMALSLVCWGSWVNTYKLAGKYRFEIYYLDFAIGCLLMALICAFTFGNLGFDGFSFLDDLEHAGKRQWFFGVLSGVVFNLGNILLLAAVSASGISIAFPIGIGAALILSSVLGYLTIPAGNSPMLFAGCALAAAAIVVAAIQHNILGVIRHESLARAGKTRSTRRPMSIKAVLLALCGGLILGSYSGLLDKATETEVGLGPYSLMVLFAVGVVFSTPVYDIFFMNLPVEGDLLDAMHYFRAGRNHHLLGILGGMIWCGGALALFVAASAPAEAHVTSVLTGVLTRAYPVLAALWGILAWRELREGDGRVKLLALVTLVLLSCAVALLALAPVLKKS